MCFVKGRKNSKLYNDPHFLSQFVPRYHTGLEDTSVKMYI